jgi:ribonucleotide reductase alpha subunit
MRPFKREAQIQKWTDQGIWKKLQYHGAADNMLVEFDMDDLDKSFKFNK